MKRFCIIQTCYYYSLIIGLSLFIFSCKNEIQDAVPSSISFQESSIGEQDFARTKFAKILAKALENKDVRAFIKKESLKMFDNDYDVLYHGVKNKIADNDHHTFHQLLSNYADNSEEFNSIVSKLPKLNILVPDLSKANAKTWDTEKMIPLVAVSNSEQEVKGINFVRAYNSKGIEYKLDPFKEPEEVTLVVKNNERIEITSNAKGGRTNANTEWVPYFAQGDLQFYFSGEGFINNSSKTKSAKTNNVVNGVLPSYGLSFTDYSNISFPTTDFGIALAAGYWPLAPEYSLKYFVNYIPELNSINRGSIRKSVYYKKDGTLNQNVKERLMYVRFTSDAALAYASDGWLEGYLDLQCVIAMLKVRPGEDFDKKVTFKSIPLAAGYTNLGQTTKQNFIDNNILTQFDVNTSNSFAYDVRGTWINWFDEGFNWSPFLYGDQMQYVFYEKDDGAEITEEYTVNTSINANFGIGIKDLFNVGFSGSSTNSQKLTIKTTRASQQLGEYVMTYGQDIGFARSPIGIGQLEFIVQAK